MKDVETIDDLDKWFAFGDDWKNIVAQRKNLEELNQRYKLKYEHYF